MFPFAVSRACDPMRNLPQFKIDDLKMQVLLALEEDIGFGDITTDALVPPSRTARAVMPAKQEGVVCGIDVAKEVFLTLDSSLDFKANVRDGDAVTPGTLLAELSGAAAPILKAERTALNFIQRLSGIATLTRKFVDAVAGFDAAICDTRKTTPGWRKLEKHAVACGGGTNHRMGLYDAVLIKDNHIEVAKKAGMSIAQILAKFQDKAGNGMVVQIEARTLEDVRECVAAGAAMILLDNMGIEEMRRAVEMGKAAKGEVIFEASGNVNLDTVRQIAGTGVHRISVGALTHSAPVLDISLDVHMQE